MGELVGGGVGGRVGGRMGGSVGDLVGGSATVFVGDVVGTWALEVANRRNKKAVAVMVELVVVVILIDQNKQRAMCYRVEIMDNELCGGRFSGIVNRRMQWQISWEVGEVHGSRNFAPSGRWSEGVEATWRRWHT